jgi:hypothetical protein
MRNEARTRCNHAGHMVRAGRAFIAARVVSRTSDGVDVERAQRICIDHALEIVGDEVTLAALHGRPMAGKLAGWLTDSLVAGIERLAPNRIRASR